MNRILLVGLCLLSLLSFNRSRAAIPVVVDTFKVFDESVPPLEAKNRTLAFARECAIQKAVPELVATSSLISDMRAEVGKTGEEQTSFSIFAISSQAGYIVDETVLPIEMKPGNGVIRYNVKLKAKVEPTKGERNPSIALDLQAKSNYLHDGEQLILTAKSSVDGYLYLFYFLSDNTVLLMFPNFISKDNFCKANVPVQIPTPEDQKRGLRYVVSAIPGRKVTAENIFGVFCVNKIAGIDQFVGVKQGMALVTGGDESFTDFQKWLANVPLSQRTEKAVPIHIVK
ncbi:MAG: DUF4384 domain-containing protein [Candidatus Neomarinimicrobiota bacterium]